MSKLKIAPGLSLPLELVTQTLAILAQKRKGKSYLARRIVEQLHHAGQQVVVVDPKGDWWGLRSAADGKHPGLPIVIVGGERGDVPLEPSGGEVVAKLVVEERVSVLLDLSLLRKHEVATFMVAFLENLYRLKAREIYRTPVMLVIDEADAIAPQTAHKTQPNMARMLGAADDIVRRGGQRGIGCMMITQRSAVLNKDVLSQIQVLVTLCTIAPQDLKAIESWIDVHGTRAQRDKLMESLPALPQGDAWWWSPGWPTAEGIFERKRSYPIDTFDSGATPKVGEKRREPKKLADVDLEALKRQMADTIERAKAEDPKALRKRVAELEKDLARTKSTSLELAGRAHNSQDDRVKELQRQLAEAQKKAKVVEKPVVTPAQIARLERVVKNAVNVSDDIKKHVAVLSEALAKARQPEIAYWGIDKETTPVTVSFGTSTPKTFVPKRVRQTVNGEKQGLSKCARALLVALAQRDHLSRAQLATLSGYSLSSSSFSNGVSEVYAAGHVVKESGRIAITNGGIAALEESGGIPPTVRTVGELRELWKSKISKAARAMFDVLLVHGAVYREALSEMSGYSITSSSFSNAISELHTNGIIEKSGREIALVRELRGT